MKECENCGRYYNLWINGSTLITENNNEYSLCDYCSKDFNEEGFCNEKWISLTK